MGDFPTYLDLLRYELRHGSSTEVAYKIDGWTNSHRAAIKKVTRQVFHFSNTCDKALEDIDSAQVILLGDRPDANVSPLANRIAGLKHAVELAREAFASQHTRDQEATNDVTTYILDMESVVAGVLYACGESDSDYPAGNELENWREFVKD